MKRRNTYALRDRWPRGRGRTSLAYNKLAENLDTDGDQKVGALLCLEACNESSFSPRPSVRLAIIERRGKKVVSTGGVLA